MAWFGRRNTEEGDDPSPRMPMLEKIAKINPLAAERIRQFMLTVEEHVGGAELLAIFKHIKENADVQGSFLVLLKVAVLDVAGSADLKHNQSVAEAFGDMLKNYYTPEGWRKSQAETLESLEAMRRSGMSEEAITEWHVQQLRESAEEAGMTQAMDRAGLGHLTKPQASLSEEDFDEG